LTTNILSAVAVVPSIAEGNTLSKTTFIKVPGVAAGWLRVDDSKKENQRESILTDQREDKGTKGGHSGNCCRFARRA